VFESVKQRFKAIEDGYRDSISVSGEHKTSGNGLGLFLSRQLVQFLNGDIKVKSQKNVGTSITITFEAELKARESSRHDTNLPTNFSTGNKDLIQTIRFPSSGGAFKKNLSLP